jgi:hypothetical protein
MRSLSSSAISLLASGREIPVVLLIEMQLTAGTLYMNTSMYDIDWNGQTWIGLGGIGNVAPIEDTSGELQPLKFSIMACDQSIVAMALGQPVQGRPCIMRTMLLDPDSHAVIDVQTVWTGTLDQMQYEEPFDGSIGAPTISVSAEHRGVAMQRPRPIRYTDADQKALVSSTDRMLQYVLAQAQHQDVWPAAAWFRT